MDTPGGIIGTVFDCSLFPRNWTVPSIRRECKVVLEVYEKGTHGALHIVEYRDELGGVALSEPLALEDFLWAQNVVAPGESFFFGGF